MPLEIKKQNRENSQSLVRRFSQKIRQSGILRRVKEIQFYHRPKSSQLKKRSALRKKQRREEFARLKKLGKLSKPTFYR